MCRASGASRQDELFSPAFSAEETTPEINSSLLYREGVNSKVCVCVASALLAVH